MASIKGELTSAVSETLYAPWNMRAGTVVPTTETVALLGGGVELDAVVLYADLAQSSKLASEFDQRVAAKVIKSFLICAVKIIKKNDGEVTSFDGDRVMGIFLGASKNSNAAKCALQINWAVSNLIRPKLTEYFTSIKASGFQITHGCGVDSGKVLAVRAGVRGANDLIWIGRPPNFAAKLSDIRDSSYTSYISSDVYSRLNEESKLGGDPKREMWSSCTWEWQGERISIYRSSWHWAP